MKNTLRKNKEKKGEEVSTKGEKILIKKSKRKKAIDEEIMKGRRNKRRGRKRKKVEREERKRKERKSKRKQNKDKK